MNQYIYFLTLARPEAATDMTPAEEAVVDQHFAYLTRATERGQCIIAGRCVDIAYGIVVFEAETDAAAADFLTADPAIAGGVMRGELHPYRVALLRRS